MKNATIVLIHAAFADGSSWNKVILPLKKLGFEVIAAPIPLTSLSDDVMAVKRMLHRVQGPVILAAHSYGGAVMTATSGESNVKALVYIAAMAPDTGETVGGLLHRADPHPAAPSLAPDENGLIWMSPQGFANAVAPDSSQDEIALMFATQRPIHIACLGEVLETPAWRDTPSWYLLAAKDRIIAPHTQRFMAERAKARTREVDTDHTPLSSAPNAVVEMIVEAADASL